jgi:UDP-N-acetylmuramate dehydrogenase
MKLQENIPLAPLTTLGVGGQARYYLEAPDRLDVISAAQFAKNEKLPLLVLGSGSNLVVADAGFEGVVVKIGPGGFSVTYPDSDPGKGAITVAVGGADGGCPMIRAVPYRVGRTDCVIRAEAGESWDDIVETALRYNAAGIECLSGIPGTVGATPVQNVGAYGQEVAETIEEIDVLDRTVMDVRTLKNAECGFGYRSSRFNTTDRDLYIILSVTFRLRWNGEPNLRYADLQRVFGARARPSLQQVREAVLQIRRSKSMVLDPDDENRRSAGSFFKNPVVPVKVFEQLDDRLRSRGLAMPSYPAAEDMRKLSAAWLVEQAGFYKGYSSGAAGISTRHSLAIVNRGGATAAEIVALKNEIQTRVMSEFGIELTPEPVFVGF